MYIHNSFDTYSDRHVLGYLLLCAGVIVLLCRGVLRFAVLAIQRQHTYSYKLLLHCCCCIPVQRFRPLRSLTKKHGLERQIYFRCKQATCKCQELHAPGKQTAACMYVSN